MMTRQRLPWTTPKQSDRDREILDTYGHSEGPRFNGPDAVDYCKHYDDHRSEYFYRKGNGRWFCAFDED